MNRAVWLQSTYEGGDSEDSDNDLSRWQPGSPHVIRSHGERLAMSPTDFGGSPSLHGSSMLYDGGYGDMAAVGGSGGMEPRRRY